MTCQGCGAALTKRHQRLYCSNRCQSEARRAARVAQWLASGVGQPDAKPRHYIRLFLREAQDGQCAVCGLTDLWNGRPLSFVLDHVDGNSANNERSNLRLVCPNCDSQLPTYKARNRGQGRAWRRQRYADGKSY